MPKHPFTPCGDAFLPPTGAAGAAHHAESAEAAARRARKRALRARAEQVDAPPEPHRALTPAGWGPPERGDWPRPPSAIPAARLTEPPQGARVTVCGLVIVRQRPGSANGVIFATLEDETGVVNVIIWNQIYQRFRRAVIASRLMRATGRVQREGQVIHVVAEHVEDVSHLLDRLAAAPRAFDQGLAPADEVRRPNERGGRPEKIDAADRARAQMGRAMTGAPQPVGIARAQPRAMHPRDQAKRLIVKPEA